LGLHDGGRRCGGNSRGSIRSIVRAREERVQNLLEVTRLWLRL
jgi:hypothetical protein